MYSISKIVDQGFWVKKQPQVVWEVNFSNIILRVERYGSPCSWDKIKIKKGKTEVYRLTKDRRFSGDQDVGIRKEFFFNELSREYAGDQFSFIEYINMILEQKRFPNPKEYTQSGLEAEIEKQYRRYLQRILNN